MKMNENNNYFKIIFLLIDLQLDVSAINDN